MPRILLLALLWLLQAGLVVLLVSADWIDAQASRERQQVAQEFGQVRYTYITQYAQQLNETWFVQSGLKSASYVRLLPDASQRQPGMENLAPWFFEWLRRRLDAFWTLVLQVIYRMLVLREWRSIVLLTVMAALVDGLVQRQLTRARREHASADRYLFARRALAVLLFAPFVYLTAPLALSPSLVPLWAILFALSLMLLAAHAQHRL